MQYLVILVILTAVVVFVTMPLRRGGIEPATDAGEGNLADLEAAREAKYRELRDADLDHRTGKLSDADFDQLDRTLRGEAITILRGLDAEQERSGEPE
jgi:hypothetical protein